MLNLALSILPGVLIIIYIYKKDKYEKEPKHLIFKCVLLGMLSIIPAVIGTLSIESMMGVENPGESASVVVLAIYAFVAVGLSEEFGKFLFLRYYIYRKDEFDEPMDGIVYAVAIGMGFAILENIFYVLNGGLSVALMRMFTAVPAHAAFAVIMGYYVGLAKFEKHPSKVSSLMSQGIIYAALVHGAYDFFLFSNNVIGLFILAFVVLIAAIFMSRKLINIHVENSPHKVGEKKDISDHFIDD